MDTIEEPNEEQPLLRYRSHQNRVDNGKCFPLSFVLVAMSKSSNGIETLLDPDRQPWGAASRYRQEGSCPRLELVEAISCLITFDSP